MSSHRRSSSQSRHRGASFGARSSLSIDSENLDVSQWEKNGIIEILFIICYNLKYTIYSDTNFKWNGDMSHWQETLHKRIKLIQIGPGHFHRTFAKALPKGWSSTLQGLPLYAEKLQVSPTSRDRFLSLAQSLMRVLLAEVCEVRMSRFAGQRIESNINLHFVWFLMVKHQFFLLSTELTILFASVSQSRTQPMQRRMFRSLCPPLQFRISSWVVPGPWTPTATEPAGGRKGWPICCTDPVVSRWCQGPSKSHYDQHPKTDPFQTSSCHVSPFHIISWCHLCSKTPWKTHACPTCLFPQNGYGSTVRMNPWNRSLSPIDPPFFVIKKTCEPYPKIKILCIYIYYILLYTHIPGVPPFFIVKSPGVHRQMVATGPASSFANGPPFSARNRRLSGSDAFRAPGPRKPKDPQRAAGGDCGNQQPNAHVGIHFKCQKSSFSGPKDVEIL